MVKAGQNSIMNINGDTEVSFSYSGLNILIEYAGNLPLSQYILLLSSIFSMWFGFTMYFSAISFSKFAFNFKHENSKKYAGRLFLALCLISCIFHFTFETKNYLLYPTQSAVEIEIERIFTPPDESYCFHKKSLGNISDPIELVSKFEYFDTSKNHFSSVNNSSDMKKYFESFLKFPSKCIKVRSNGNDMEIDLEKLFKENSLAIYSRIFFNLTLIYPENYLKSINIYVNSHSHYPWSTTQMGNSIYFNTVYRRSFVTGTHTTESQSLPPPVSNCKEYGKTGIKSQDHCIDSCIRFKDSNDKNRSFIQLIHHETSDEIQLKEDQDIFNKFTAECLNHCPNSCKLTFLELRQSGFHQNYDLVLDSYAKRHDFVTIRITDSLKSTLLDYLIFLGEIHGLWFGLAIWSLGIDLMSIILKIIPENTVSPST